MYERRLCAHLLQQSRSELAQVMESERFVNLRWNLHWLSKFKVTRKHWEPFMGQRLKSSIHNTFCIAIQLKNCE